MTETRWRALLFAVALLPRLVSCLGSAIFGTDSGHYLLMADWMREGRFQEALSVAYHPMYPALIATTSLVTASSEQAGNLLSVVLGSAAVLPLYELVRAVFGRPAAAMTSILYAFSPALIEVQSDVMTEGTFIFFLFSSAWLTWRMMEAPSPERGAVLGGAAAAAFLTRPEGLLPIAFAVFWPLAALAFRRPMSWKGAGAVGLTVLTVALLVAPYLLWVKSERGGWGISLRPSAISAERAVALSPDGEDLRGDEGRSRLYRIYGVSLFRLTLYGALIPFYILGLAPLRRIPGRSLVFYLSYPAGLLAGVLLTLRTHTFMSERYLLAGMTLLSAVAGLGLVEALRRVTEGRPESRLRPAACAVVLALLLLVPGSKCLKLRRQELRSYPAAGRWIREHDPQAKAVVGLEQVAYYSGSRSYYAPMEKAPLLAMLDRQPTDYIVYSEKDVRGRPEYVAMLRSLSRLDPAVEVEGPAGTWKVYIHRVR